MSKSKVSPVKSPSNGEAKKIEGFATQIGAAWHHTVEAILKVATLCAKASTELTEGACLELQKKLPFSGPTFSKLKTIGQDKRLYDPKLLTKLPPSFSTLYEYAKMNERSFELAKKLMRPDITREKVKAAGRPQNDSPPLPKPFYAGIVLQDALTPKQLREVQTWLEVGKRMKGVKEIIDRQPEFRDEFQVKTERWKKEVLKRLRPKLKQELKTRSDGKSAKINASMSIEAVRQLFLDLKAETSFEKMYEEAAALIPKPLRPMLLLEDNRPQR